MPKWLLPTLSEVLALSDPTWRGNDHPHADRAWNSTSEPGLRRRHTQHALRQLRAEREWTGAIAALDKLLQVFIHPNSAIPTINLSGDTQGGFVLSGPSPVLSNVAVAKALSTWTLAATSVHAPNWLGLQLLPSEKSAIADDLPHSVLPLLPGDPVAAEQFCLVLTPWFSLVMVLGETLTEEPAFTFSFAPEVVQRAWETLRPRILLMSSHQVDFLDELVQQFPPVAPDFKTVMQFGRLMLEHMPEPIADTRFEEANFNASTTSKAASHSPNSSQRERLSEVKYQESTKPNKIDTTQVGLPAGDFDVELVKAIAHEVRTPLTTIRTLTRSLLKRNDLAPDVLRRLSIIDRECSEQIDRFGLIFKAVELETSTPQQSPMSLIRTSLTHVLEQSVPRWQQHASQRQMTLDVVLPQRMPAVVSDPTVLDQALTSLIERFTRNLPAGSHIQVEVTPAGDQLKLQLQSQAGSTQGATERQGAANSRKPKLIGQMLMFQPETGSLSLNLSVTKNLFQAIGGKLIVKQRPRQGEVMTVYLPLEVGSISPLDSNKIITV